MAGLPAAPAAVDMGPLPQAGALGPTGNPLRQADGD